MARIKVKDLSKDTKISKEEMKRVKGGVLLTKSDITIKMDLYSDKWITSIDTFYK